MKPIMMSFKQMFENSSYDNSTLKLLTANVDIEEPPEKEKLEMEQFKKINGFAADDDDAKRAIVDEVVYAILGRYPKDDEERNHYTHSRENPMMRIGWKPLV